MAVLYTDIMKRDEFPIKNKMKKIHNTTILCFKKNKLVL